MVTNDKSQGTVAPCLRCGGSYEREQINSWAKRRHCLYVSIQTPLLTSFITQSSKKQWNWNLNAERLQSGQVPKHFLSVLNTPHDSTLGCWSEKVGDAVCRMQSLNETEVQSHKAQRWSTALCLHQHRTTHICTQQFPQPFSRFAIIITTLWVKKTRHYNIVHNFAKCWPIFKLLSLTDSLVNLQQNLD